jgi:hypothetical protein
LSKSITESKIVWTDRQSSSNSSLKITSKELEGISLWMQHMSQIEPRVIDDKPKVEVKKK